MSVNIYTFKVEGLSPLLMSNPVCMLEESETSVRTKKISPEQEAKSRTYINEEGQLYVPSIAFLNSLWEGAAYQKIGKDSARSRIQSSVFVTEPETILLDNKTGNPITEYEIDTRFVVLQKKNRIIRHRPLVKNWHCLLSLEIDADYIEVDYLVILFNRAGRIIGVLDYRPAKRGPFGRYKAELYNGVKRTKRI